MRLGVVILPELTWPEAAQRWRRAEELGFDHAWTYDHLAWRSLADSAWFGAVPTLAAAAAVTERMRLGTLVTSPNFRHPVVLGRDVITLDHISAGRFTVGIGAGGRGWDERMLGQGPLTQHQREARLAEFVEILDAMLRHPVTNYEGDFYAAVDARTHPGCVQQPRVPLAVAGVTAGSMQTAVRHADAWVTTGDRHAQRPLPVEDGVAVVARQMERLDQVCREAGRQPSSIERVVLTGPHLDPGLDSKGRFSETLAAYAEIGVTDLVVHWPRPDDPYRGDPALFEACVTG